MLRLDVLRWEHLSPARTPRKARATRKSVREQQVILPELRIRGWLGARSTGAPLICAARRTLRCDVAGQWQHAAVQPVLERAAGPLPTLTDCGRAGERQQMDTAQFF